MLRSSIRWHEVDSLHVCHSVALDTAEIKFQIPESLTGSIYYADALSSILQSKVAKEKYILPGEALVNPAGDFLVSFGDGNSVRVFAIRQQGIEPKPVLSVPTNLESNVVMVQWALGQHVREWESELQVLQKLAYRNPR